MQKRRRTKGSGSLYKRGSTYWARWCANGIIYKRSTGQTDRAGAEKALADFVAPFRMGSEVRVLESIAARIVGVKAELSKYENSQPGLSISNAWSAFVASPNRPDPSERTMYMYECEFGRFTRWLSEHHPNVVECRHVTPLIASEFVGHLNSELSANTYNKYVTLMRGIWNVLVDEIKSTSNPWSKIRQKTESPHSRRELTVEELADVCGSVSGELRTLFAIGIYTGLRLGDAAQLDWGTVDIVRGTITLLPRKTAKTGTPVLIPIHSALMSILTECPAPHRGPVLPELAELHRRRSTELNKQIKAVFARCGIVTDSKTGGGRAAVDVGFHSLRHTFVSLSANAGTPMAVVQAIVGHSNPAMTRHYFHSSQLSLRNAVDALPDVSGGNTGTSATDATQAKADAIRSAFRDLPRDVAKSLLEELRQVIEA